MKSALIAVCALHLAAAQAWAQSAPASGRPDPADPKAVVAPTYYQSAFEGYRKHADAKVESWRGVNDNVGQIGGWRIYLKEAQQPDPAAAGAPPAKPSPPPVATKPAPAGHGHH